MAFVHGRNTVVSWNSVDLSAFINQSDMQPSADSHDVSAYGDDGHEYDGGLTDGTFAVQGLYDDGMAGPRATLASAIGTKATLLFQPEGAGSGKAQSTGDALLLNYHESDPVAGMITWTARWQLSGTIDHSAQNGA